MTPAEQVNDAMARIRRWCEANGKAKLVFDCMNPPATDADLDAAEQRIGRPLPEDVRALYKVANGQDEHAEANEDEMEVGLFPWTERELAHLLYPLGDEENVMSRGDPEDDLDVQPGWFPLASNMGGDEVAIDLHPDSPRPGRVLHFNHEGYGAREVAPSLAQHLTDIADLMEAGGIEFNEEGLVYVDPPGFDDDDPDGGDA